LIDNLGDEMTRLEELEEQSRHLMDKVRTKRRKVEDMKNDLKVNTKILTLEKFRFFFYSELNVLLKNYIMIK
jgi:magnesium-transporting ATPase (P-type)